jgi:hypothetical protein
VGTCDDPRSLAVHGFFHTIMSSPPIVSDVPSLAHRRVIGAPEA